MMVFKQNLSLNTLKKLLNEIVHGTERGSIYYYGEYKIHITKKRNETVDNNEEENEPKTQKPKFSDYYTNLKTKISNEGKYDKLKSQGLCVACSKRKAVKNRFGKQGIRCEECYKKKRASDLRYKARK